jgi:hypothetical protein
MSRKGDANYASETIPRTIKTIPKNNANWVRNPCSVVNHPGAVVLTVDMPFASLI